MPTHSQLCPSAADEYVVDKYASDWWGDLIGGFSYYGSSSYDPSGEGGSRPPGAPRSDDDGEGRDGDGDE